MALAAVAFVRWPLHPFTSSHSRATTVLYGGESSSNLIDPGTEEGPLMIQISYQVRPECVNDFLHAARAVRLSCRRNGAIFWRMFREIDTPNLYVERYMLDSWMDHTRHLDRTTKADRAVRERLAEFLVMGTTPQVRHQFVESVPGES